jgi:hypothetical protein
MKIKNCIVCGEVSLFLFSLVAPALREAMALDKVEQILAADSRAPFDFPHIEPAIRTPEIQPSLASMSVTGWNPVNQSHQVDAHIAWRNA